MNKLETAQEYAIKCHLGTAHEYDGKPYTFHLRMVVSVADSFIHLIPEQNRETVLAACWCHDVIEDCRQTYNDVKNVCGIEVAEIVYALTNEKGKNRKERANEKYYAGIRETPYAAFVKICDRLANVKYSKDSGSSMLDKYRREQMEFYKSLYQQRYVNMFLEIENLLVTN